MNSGIENLNTNKQLNVNQSELTNMNHNIASQDPNVVNQPFKKTELKIDSKGLNTRTSSVSEAESNPLIKKENTEKNSTNNEKNLDETIKNLETSKTDLAELEKSKKNIEDNLERIKKAEKNLKNFEKSWMIGKFVTGWKESTLAQKILTFAKVAITVVISTALFVLSGGGLGIALLVASLSIGLLYYFAKDVVNIAKEKLTSALSEAYRKAMNFECKGIKDATKGITETVEKIKNGLYNCKNDLIKQATNIENLKSKIVELKGAIEEEKKNKEKEINECKDQINKQKEKIAEITKDLASTISSSLTNSAEVKERTKSNISLVEEAKKEIELIKGACGEITKDSQEIKELSDGITNQIKEFNQSTVDKLKKFIKNNNIEDQSKKVASEKIDDIEDKTSKQKSDKLYSVTGFSAEESEDSNETIKKLIDKISNSNVDPIKFAKLLTEIVNDQNKMNKAIMESSTKISKLAGKIHNEHVENVQAFCEKIATALENIETNEKTLLNMQAEYIGKLFSTAEKIIFEKFPEMKNLKEAGFLNEMKKHIQIDQEEESFLLFFYRERKNNAIINLKFEQLTAFSNILHKIEQTSDTNKKKRKNGAHDDIQAAQNLINILGETSNILTKIEEINKKCTDNISTIQDNEIKNIGAMADQINKSIESIQEYSSKLTVKTINKSAHIATASAGAIIGGTAVGVLGTTVGFPVTLAVGSVGLLGTALYKVIEHYKSDKH